MAVRTFRVDAPSSDVLVSILVPVYNAGRFLEATLKSLLTQTYKDIEIVLLDDCSTDDSMKIAEGFRSADPRIVVLPGHERNRGVVATRSELLYEARGAFIAWNDADDISKPERIARQVDFLRGNPSIGAVGTGIVYADESLRPIRVESYPADPQRQRVDPKLCCATLLCRREAARDAGPFRAAFRYGGEDGDWLLKMADRHDITNIDNALYVYRRHPSSLTNNHHKTALTVRLGVMARAAARARRSGHDDPIDSLDPERVGEQLSALSLLASPILAPEEIVTCISHALDGEMPAISIGLVVDPDMPPIQIDKVLDGYRVQSLRSFELVLAAPSSRVQNLQRELGLRNLTGRVISRHDTAEGTWHALLEAARGRYFMFTGWRRPKPWKTHELLRTLVYSPDAPAVIHSSSILRRWQTTPDRITRSQMLGGIPDLVVGRASALDLSKNADGLDCLGGLPVENRLANHMDAPEGLIESAQQIATAAIRSLRHQGPLGFAKSVVRRAGFADVRKAGRWLVYERLIPGLMRNPMGRSLANSAAIRPIRLLVRRTFIGKDAAPAGAQALVQPAARPAHNINYAAAARDAKVKVAVYESWGDFEDSLHCMTPHATALWDGVLFAPAAALDEPDFALVLNTPTEEHVTVELPPNRIWFAIGEPPTETHRGLQDGQGTGTVVLTCDEGFPAQGSSKRRYIHTPVMTRSWHVKRTIDELDNLPVLKKPRRLSWITSNIGHLPGHRRRLAFLNELRKHVEFDLYGRGFTPIDDKWDALAPYRYSIAFENTVAPLYFTEKVMDCFVCQTMPFYCGSLDLARYFPEDSFVAIDPDDPHVYERINEIASSDLWLERQDALAEARHLVLYTHNMYRRLADLMLKEMEQPPSPRVRMTIDRRVVL